MAEVVTPVAGAQAPAEPAEPLVAPPRSGGRSYRGRFGVVYAALGLVLGVAIAGFIVLAVQPGKAPEAAWSSWRPEGDSQEEAQQIADYVAPRYRLPSGRQLVSVQATPPRVQDVPIGAIAIQSSPSGARYSGNSIPVFAADNSVVYILCGLGQDCAIEEGTPSAERLRLLRREGLELALYTFRYLDGKDSVVAFLPPKSGEKPSFALFFQRGELAPELKQPLSATLPDPAPPLQDQISPTEVGTIDRLTAPRLFRYSFLQGQDGTAFLVLDDPTTPAPAQTQDSSQQGATTQ